ncbi:MAG: glycoside hydrolase family 5 protein [Ruminococcus sp.]|nr:glycoside hydrolase family 5 protein [Ruminococcus sp.]
MSFKKKFLSVVSALAFGATCLTGLTASAADANTLLENLDVSGGYSYIDTYYTSTYYAKSAFEIQYEYVSIDDDGEYYDRDTDELTAIDYSDTFEFLVFDTSWGGWNATKVGVSEAEEGTVYTATVSISGIESKLDTGLSPYGINLETGRIGDTKVRIISLKYVNDTSVESSNLEASGSWVKGTGGTMEVTSGTATVSFDEWKIDISKLCVYSFTNPTIDVTVNYETAPNDYVQAEILDNQGNPIVSNYPYVSESGKVTYTTEFDSDLTALSLCYDSCTVTTIKIYDNTDGNTEYSVSGKSATEIANDMGMAWNLGNALDCVNSETGKVDETCWGNPVTTKKLIQAVKEQGFNTIRIPISYLDKIVESTENGSATYTVDDDYLARIKQVVDYAYDMGMYVVIDMHNDGGEGVTGKWLDITKSGDEFTEIVDKYSDVWTDIATYFADYDQKLIFEGFNELMNGNYSDTPAEDSYLYTNINTLNNAFVSAVRSTGDDTNDDRILIVAGYNTDIDCTITGFDVPEDSSENKLMLSVHYYSPYDFVLNESGTSSYTSSDLSSMATSISNICSFASKSGMPVFIGEYGPIDKTNTTARAEYCYYLNYYAASNSDATVVLAFWDNGVTTTYGSGLFNRTSNTVTDTGSTIISYIKAGYSCSSIPS